MIKSSDMTSDAANLVSIRITRNTRVTGLGRVEVGQVVSIPEPSARMLIAQRQAEPAPMPEKVETRKRKTMSKSLK